MFIAVDIGNTSISVGLFKHGRIIFRGQIPTHSGPPRILREMHKVMRKATASGSPLLAGISSVVPKATKELEMILRKSLQVRAFVIGRDISVCLSGISIKSPSR